MKLLFNLLLLTCLFLFNSCDNETPSTVGGGGRIKFDISISPPLKNGDQFQGQSAVGAFVGITEGYSGEITPEYAVTKGQNLPFILSLSNYNNLGCHTVTIKAILNGSIFDTQVFELGWEQWPSPQKFCKDGYTKSVNYIIP